MDGLWIGVLGTSGTILSSAALMPQVVHTWRTRSTDGISAAWLTVALVSTLIWAVYGGLIGALAVTLTNVVCFLQCASILFIKLQNSAEAAADRVHNSTTS
jgi:MtN3 and saliva related transmembrane protein